MFTVLICSLRSLRLVHFLCPLSFFSVHRVYCLFALLAETCTLFTPSALLSLLSLRTYSHSSRALCLYVTRCVGLGLGGAEMLVVNAAVAAMKAGHDVTIYTSHHDGRRCFRDTTGDGKCQLLRGGIVSRTKHGQ